jgi:hypothetical protein
MGSNTSFTLSGDHVERVFHSAEWPRLFSTWTSNLAPCCGSQSSGRRRPMPVSRRPLGGMSPRCSPLCQNGGRVKQPSLVSVVAKSIPASMSTSPHRCRCPSNRGSKCCRRSGGPLHRATDRALRRHVSHMLPKSRIWEAARTTSLLSI